MCKCLIGISHTVDVFAAAYSSPFAVERGDKFIGQLLSRRPTLLFADRQQDPANRQRLLPCTIDLHRHLVGGTTDALAPDLDRRLHVLEGLREYFNRFLIRNALLHDFESVVKHVLRDTLLAVAHERIDELCSEDRPIHRIGLELFATCGNATHKRLSAIGCRLSARQICVSKCNPRALSRQPIADGRKPPTPSSRRNDCVIACDLERPTCREHREQPDSERLANREFGRRGRARYYVPAAN